MTDWLRDTGRSFERLSSASSFKRALWQATTAPNLRHLGFEPLEQRQLLTATNMLSFSAVPFSVDPSTQNLVVNYHLDASAPSTSFLVKLVAFDTNGIAITPALMTQSVSTVNMTGDQSLSFGTQFLNEVAVDYTLQVQLDPEHTLGDELPDDNTMAYSGAFKDGHGIVEVEGTAGGNWDWIRESGTNSALGLSATVGGGWFSSVTGLHIRTLGGNDLIQLDANVTIPTVIYGRDSTDRVTISGTTNSDTFGVSDNSVSLNGSNLLSYSAIHSLALTAGGSPMIDGGEGVGQIPGPDPVDTFNVTQPLLTAAPMPVISVAGSGNDILNLSTAANTGQTVSVSNTQVSVANTASTTAVTFSGVPTLNVTAAAGDTGDTFNVMESMYGDLLPSVHLTAAGGSGNSLVIDDTADVSSFSPTIGIDATKVSIGSHAINYTSFNGITVNTSSSKVFTVTEPATAILPTLTLGGGSGTNQLTIVDTAPTSNQTVRINSSAVTIGPISTPTSAINFTSFNGGITVNTDGASDAFTVTEPATGSFPWLNLRAGAGSSSLTIDDTAPTTNQTVGISSTAVKIGTAPNINYQSFNYITVNTHNGNDAFTVTKPAAGSFPWLNLGAGGGTSSLTIDDTAPTTNQTVGISSGTVTIGTTFIRTINYTSFNGGITVNTSGGNDTFTVTEPATGTMPTLTLGADGGTNSLTIDDTLSTTNQTVGIGASAITIGPTPASTINYTSFNGITVNTGSRNDTFTVTQPAANATPLPATITLDGGASPSADTLTVNSVSAAPTIFVDHMTLGSGGTIHYSNVENVNLAVNSTNSTVEVDAVDTLLLPNIGVQGDGDGTTDLHVKVPAGIHFVSLGSGAVGLFAHADYQPGDVSQYIWLYGNPLRSVRVDAPTGSLGVRVVNYAGAPSVTLDLGGGGNWLEMDGTGHDTFTATNNQVTMTGSNIPLPDVINYSNVGSLIFHGVHGYSGNDGGYNSFTVTEPAAGALPAITFDGGTTTDTLTIVDTAADSATSQVIGIDNSTITIGTTSTIAYTVLGSLAVSTGNANDTITITQPAANTTPLPATITVDGGASPSADTLIVNSVSAAPTIYADHMALYSGGSINYLNLENVTIVDNSTSGAMVDVVTVDSLLLPNITVQGKGNGTTTLHLDLPQTGDHFMEFFSSVVSLFNAATYQPPGVTQHIWYNGVSSVQIHSGSGTDGVVVIPAPGAPSLTLDLGTGANWLEMDGDARDTFTATNNQVTVTDFYITSPGNSINYSNVGSLIFHGPHGGSGNDGGHNTFTFTEPASGATALPATITLDGGTNTDIVNVNSVSAAPTLYADHLTLSNGRTVNYANVVTVNLTDISQSNDTIGVVSTGTPLPLIHVSGNGGDTLSVSGGAGDDTFAVNTNGASNNQVNVNNSIIGYDQTIGSISLYGNAGTNKFIVHQPASGPVLPVINVHGNPSPVADSLYVHPIKGTSATVNASSTPGTVIGNNLTVYFWDVGTPSVSDPLRVPVLSAPLITKDQIDLVWTESSGGQDGYHVERSDDYGASYYLYKSVGPNVTSDLVAGLSPGTLYEFRVSAYNIGDTETSNVLFANTELDVPSTPIGLISTAKSTTSVHLAWANVSPAKGGFVIEQSPDISDPSLWQEVADVQDGHATSTDIHGLSPSTTYYFRVLAYNSIDNALYSNYSNTTSVTTFAAPEAPSDLAASQVSNTTINLNWIDNSNNEQGFRIEYSAGGVNDSQPVAANVTSYLLKGLSPGTAYSIDVLAFNDSDSLPSNVLAVGTTAIPPDQPTGLIAYTVSSAQINLAWSSLSGDVDSYTIEESPNDSSHFVSAGDPIAAPAHTAELNDLLAGTTYYLRLTARNSAGDSLYSDPVSATTDVAPAAPTNLQVSVVSNTQVNLVWIDGSDNEQSFTIAYTANGTTYTQPVPANTTSFLLGNLLPNTPYSFQVKAYNGTDSVPSLSVSRTTTAAVPDPLLGLTAVAVSANQIDLNWIPGLANQGTFSISQSQGDPNHFGTPSDIGWATGFSVGGLEPDTQYYFRVQAHNDFGDSAPTSIVNAVTTLAPIAPDGLQATTVSNTQINLAWSDNSNNSNNEQGFRVRYSRSDAPTNYQFLPDVAANTTSLLIGGLSPGTYYTFQVKSFNAVESSWSTPSAPTATSANVPGIPQGLTARAVSTTQITLAWTNTLADQDGFEIGQQSPGSSTFQVIPPTSAGATSALISGLTPGAVYTFRMRAHNSVNYSAGYSNLATATTLSRPAAPSLLPAQPVSNTQMYLTWTDNSDNEQGFRIDYTANGTTYTQDVSANATNFLLGNLLPNTSYSFHVTAYNGSDSDPSNGVSQSTSNIRPGVVTGLIAAAVSSAQINLTWTPVSADPSVRYRIEGSKNDTSNFKFIDSTQTNVFNATGLDANTLYYFRIVAYNTVGDSPTPSGLVSMTTLPVPARPTGLSTTLVTNTQVNLVWTDASNNVQSFEVQYDISGITYTQIVPANTTSYLVSGLSPGISYTFRVRANNGNSSPDSDPLTVTTTNAAPAALVGLVAEPASATQINLAWPGLLPDPDGYKIEISPDGVDFRPLATVPASTSSYTALRLAPSTHYYFRVLAYNVAGDGTPASADATTLAAPAAPTIQPATPVSNSQINVSWTDNSNSEQGFLLEYSTDGKNFTASQSLAANATSYLFSNLAANTKYWFRVRALGDADSDYSEVINTTTLKQLPATPTGLAAAASSSSQINLLWSNGSVGQDGFKVFQSSDGGAHYAQIGLSYDGRFSATNLPPSRTYFYRVVAYNSMGDSPSTGPVSATTLAAVVAPVNLVASALPNSSIQLTWDQSATNNEQGFLVEQSFDGITFSPWDSVNVPNTTSYLAQHLWPNQLYWFRVKAYNGTDSAPSNAASATTLSSLPGAPTALVAAPSSSSQVNLLWTAASSGQDGFTIELSTDNSRFMQIATAGSSAISYTVNNLPAGITYYFRLRAFNPLGDSLTYASASATTLSAPTTPTTLTATPFSNTQVDLAWIDTSANEQGFRIEESSDNGTFTSVGDTLPNVTHYQVTGLAPNTPYWFRVKAFNGTESAPSNPAKAITQTVIHGTHPVGTAGSAPVITSATVVSNSQVELTWTDNSSDETVYWVYQVFSSGGDWHNYIYTPIGGGGPNATSCLLTNLSQVYPYYFQVAALTATNGVGSAVSAPVTMPNNPTLNPTNFYSVAVSPTQVNLIWTNPVSAQDSFTIYHSDGIHLWTDITNLPVGTTTYSVGGLTANTPYTFELYGYDSAARNYSSAVSSVTTLFSPPAAPTNPGAVAVSNTQVQLTWTDTSNDEQGFTIEKYVGGGVWTAIGTTAANATSYLVNDLSSNTSGTLGVAAYNTAAGAVVVFPSVTMPRIPPGTPQNLKAVAVSPTQVNLMWTNLLPDQDHFAIYQSHGGPTTTVIPDLAGGSSSYPVTGLTPGTTYTFYLYAYGSGGSTSSSVVSSPVTTLSPPAAPTIISAVAVSNTQVLLKWTDHSNDEQGFRIKEYVTNTGAGPTEFDTAANATSYLFNNVSPYYQSYTFTVAAFNTTNGNDVPFPPVTMPSIPPGTPQNFKAVAVSPTQVNLMWTNLLPDQDHFAIYQSHGGPTTTVIPDLAGGSSSYPVTGLTPGTTYTFYLYAYGSGSSTSSSVVSSPVSTLALAGHTLGTSGAAPVITGATAVSNKQVQFTWTDNSNDELGFEIDRASNSNGPWSYVYTTAANATGFLVNNLSQGTYYFRVSAVNATHAAGTVSAVSGPVTMPNIQTGSPSTFSGTVVSPTQINLMWTNLLPGQEGFNLQQSINGGAWTTISPAPAAGDTSYSLSGLTPGQSYQFRLQALSENLPSNYVTTSSITTPARPAAPATLTAQAVTSTQIQLAWQDQTNNEKGFSVGYSTNSGFSNPTWIDVAPNTTKYLFGGLSPNTSYWFRVKAFVYSYVLDPRVQFPPKIESDLSNLVPATTLAAPALSTPSDLIAVAVSSTQIDLAWTNPLAGQSGFRIEQSIDAGSTWEQIRTADGDASGFSVNFLQPNTNYTFRIRTFDSTSDAATNSNWAAARTLAAPGAPDNVTAKVISNTQVELAWHDNSNNEQGFRIEQTADNVNFTQVYPVEANTTSYLVTGLTANGTYHFRVIAYNGDYESPPALAVPNSVAMLGNSPAAPIGLTALAVSQSQIRLAWTNPPGDIDGIRIDVSASGGAFAQIATIGSGTSSYDIANLAPGTNFVFKIRAFNSQGNSPYSNNAAATTFSSPIAPSNLSATPVSNTQVNLVWQDQSSNESGFTIEKSLDGINYQDIYVNNYNLLTVPANTTSYLLGGLTANTVYWFRVKAGVISPDSPNPTSFSIASNPVSVITLADVPSAPVGLTATAISGNQISLGWFDFVDNLDGFVVEQSPDGASNTFATIATTADSGYTAGHLETNTTYYFRVRAVNSAGYSDYSNIASDTTQAVPNAPSDLVAATVSDKQINLMWVDNSDNEDGFTIEQSSNGVNFDQSYTASADATSFLISGLSPDTTYYFQIKAFNSSDSDLSNIASATTNPQGLPDAPIDVAAVQISNGSVDLQWANASDNQDGFYIEQSSDGVSYTLVATLTDGQATSHTITGLTVGQSYYFRIRSYNNAGDESDNADAPPITIRQIDGGPVDDGQRTTINFDDLPAGVNVTTQYSHVRISGEASYPNRVVPSTDASAPNSIGAPSGPNVDGSGNPYDHDLYIDFFEPVNNLTFVQMRDDAAAGTVIGQVDVYVSGHFAGTVSMISAENEVDLTAYDNITRIEIVNVTDPAGLIYDDFSFDPVKVDINTDSNNDGTIDRQDDPIETDSPGRLVPLDPTGEQALAPIVIEDISSFSQSTDQLTLDYDSTILQLYSDSGGNQPLASGDSVQPNTTVFAQGIAEGTSLVTLNYAQDGGAPVTDEVRLTVQTVKLSIAGVADNYKTSPGAVIWRNSDFSKQVPAVTNLEPGLPKYVPDYISPDVFDPNTSDLTSASFTISSNMLNQYDVTFTFNESLIQIWSTRGWDGMTQVGSYWKIESGVPFTPGSANLPLFIEGINNSTGFDTDSIDVSAAPLNNSALPVAHDRVNYTVAETDIGVDGNRDQLINFQNSYDRQLLFWYNTNYDKVDSTLGVQITDGHNNVSNGSDSIINGTRDLQDMSRLNVFVGSPLFDNAFDTSNQLGSPAAGQLQATYRMYLEDANGVLVRLFGAVASASSTLLVQDETAAVGQLDGLQKQDYLLANDPFGSRQLRDLESGLTSYLFEGLGRIAQQLQVVFETTLQYPGGTETSSKQTIDLDLRPFTDFYSRYAINYKVAGVDLRLSVQPDQLVFADATALSTSHVMGMPFFASNEGIVFVHGFNNEASPTNDDKQATAETAFKRLYWQGYQGEFVEFDWPNFLMSDGLVPDPFTFLNATYNASEFEAWRSGHALMDLLQGLKSGGRVVDLLAHSQGNVVAAEALRLWEVDHGTPLVNTYVAMQGAVSAGIYGDNSTGALQTTSQTDLYRYFANGPNATGSLPWMNLGVFSAKSSATNWVNMYNPADFALNNWATNNRLKPFISSNVTHIWPFTYGWNMDGGKPVFRRVEWVLDPQSGTLVPIPVDLDPGSALIPGPDAYEVLAFIAEANAMPIGTLSVGWFDQNVKVVDLGPGGTGVPLPGGNAAQPNHSFEFYYDAATTWNFWLSIKQQTSFDSTYP